MAGSPDGQAPFLEVQDLSVRFGGLLALNRVSLRVPPARIVGLIGPNGAGKTTLFNCVTGILSPDEGRVHLFGQEVTGWPPHRRARLGMGRTFQRLELFGSLTVLENLVVAAEAHAGRGGLWSDALALPPTVETRHRALEQARAVARLVGLEACAHTPAGELPIGLARLVEVGRALCTDPRLLLLDEPSSGLSDQESAHLASLLRSLCDQQGRSLLVVEHDMPFVLGLCDDVYVLDFGTVIAHGAPDRIRRDPAVLEAYLGTESAPRGRRRAPAARR